MITVGIVLNLAILAVWVLTRTVGIAIGGDGTPDAWGKVDGLCAVFEGLAVLASVGLLSKSFSRRPLSAGVGFAGIGVLVLAVAVLTSLVFSPAATQVERERAQRRRSQPRCRRRTSADGGHMHAAPAGAGGLVDTGFGFIVTGALTGDSPCEQSGSARVGGPGRQGRRRATTTAARSSRTRSPGPRRSSSQAEQTHRPRRCA